MITSRNVEGLPDGAILWCLASDLQLLGLSMTGRKQRQIIQVTHPDNSVFDGSEPQETVQQCAAATAAEIRAALAANPQPEPDPAPPAVAPPQPARGEPISIDAAERSSETLVIDPDNLA